MSNIIMFPKVEKKTTIQNQDAKILPFKKKEEEEKGIMIDTSTLRKVSTLEEFFTEDDDILFMG